MPKNKNKNKRLLLWQIASVTLLLSILFYMFASNQAEACLQDKFFWGEALPPGDE